MSENDDQLFVLDAIIQQLLVSLHQKGVITLGEFADSLAEFAVEYSTRSGHEIPPGVAPDPKYLHDRLVARVYALRKLQEILDSPDA